MHIVRDLSDNGLLGTLDSTIGNLPQLVNLYVIYWQIPLYPESVQQEFIFVYYRALDGNYITGTLPESMGNLTSLGSM